MPNSPNSVASSIRSHSEFASHVYCEKHPTSTIRYFCHICEVELCEECWKNEHDQDDYRKHNIGFIKVNLEPQKEIQKRIVENKKDCQKMSRILEDWKMIVQQAQLAEFEHNEVLKASEANQLEQISDVVRNLIQNHITDVRKFKETILNELEELERKQKSILRDAFDSNYDRLSIHSSSSTLDGGGSSRAETPVSEELLGAVGGGGNVNVTPVPPNMNVASTLKRGKKRELVQVTQSEIGDKKISLYTAVYNTTTKEVMYLYDLDLTVLRLNGPNGKFELGKKMKWNNCVCDITLDSNNSLYGVIWETETSLMRVAVLDIEKNKELIEERELLDTEGLPNGAHVQWILCAVGETVAVTVLDWRENRYISVTLYRSHIRQQTVQLNYSLRLISQTVLVNENTLLLVCDNRTVVVSLPSQQTTTATTSAHTSKVTSNTSQKLQPKSIKYIRLSGTEDIRSIVWIPSEEGVQSDAAEGYLFASDYKPCSRVYKINLEKDVAEVAEGEEKTITHMEEIGQLDNTFIRCSIDSSTLFATTCWTAGEPMLLNLEYQTP
ncbi:uncharacterized protein LOC134852884 [Symsagittifera roscoffensis]|uniref:uncharacterized protein LOC134852884 n=1 Tax=Symsagittifera roscoffensis TaxID=84072 RepID=UPI00307B68DA